MTSNQDTITALLKKAGANTAQIAGIEGNLSVESTFNPNAYNANEGALGIAQWEGSRLTALKAYAASLGKPATDLTTQVGFLIKEGGLGVVSGATTPQQAAQSFDTQYERSSLASLPARIAAAVGIYNGGSVSGSGTSSTPAASTSVAPTAKNYFASFLAALGIKDSPGAEQALASVENYEGNNDRYNPFNVIQPEPGSTNFNSVGVQSYTSFDTGVQGSATLFQGSHWDAVRSALATGNATTIINAFDQAYSWSPGTNIPLLSGTQLQSELTRNVGANPGTGVTGGGSAGGTGTGSVEDAISIPGAPSWLNDLLGAAGDAATAPTKLVDLVAHIFSAFTNPENWLRFGLIFIGLVVLIIGVDKVADGGLVSMPSSSGDSVLQQPSEPQPVSVTVQEGGNGTRTTHTRYKGDSSPYGNTSKATTKSASKRAPAKKAPAKKAPASALKGGAADTAEVAAA